MPDPDIVMAEQTAHDVVNEAKSMGDSVPIDTPATTSEIPTAGNGTVAANTADDTEQADTTAEAVMGESHSDNARASQSASPAANQVNGAESSLLSPEDRLARQSAVDLSGGSDTDTSRGDDLGKGNGSGHVRSGSIKKPTAFKAVSVTKNFLAKSAAAPAVSKPGEKGATTSDRYSFIISTNWRRNTGAPTANSNASTPPPTAKPRLVAKSASALGGGSSRLASSKLNGAGNGPDANKVWNKNRPVPPPPPKQFTDEELKQQYGIHMATRLQADEAGKDKWADIDDDEDDWAPETVEWMDGTKSSVVTGENQPPPFPTDELPTPPASDDVAKSPQPAPKSTSKPDNQTTKTILKPGGQSNASQPKPSGGLVLKGAPEKPSLVAKPSAPAAVKSPWAALPPVERVSPIAPPVQASMSSRFSQRDSHSFDVLSLAPSPAKEIAADDFNRTWRDERGNKELFNSQSGRYEPVNEMRRGSVRHEGHSLRQPAVLQRPSQQQGHGGPAEPSAAFQTSRSGGAMDGAWSRRRGSSNVSGGSGAQARRMSISHSQDGDGQMHSRRDSQALGSADAATSIGTGRPVVSSIRGPHPDGSASPSHQRPWPRPSPALSQATPDIGPIQSPATGDTNPAAQAAQILAEESNIQQRMMREKIELARAAKQRRIEEEEREEAAKAERLRLKLAQLEDQSPQSKEVQPSTPAAGSRDMASKSTLNVSPPKPPVPTAEGETVQYGMIKVHQAHAVKKTMSTDPSAYGAKKSPDVSQTSASAPATTSVKSPDMRFQHGQNQEQRKLVQLPRDGAAEPGRGADVKERYEASTSLERDASAAWKSSAPAENNNYPWSNNSMSTHSAPSNVWGPPSRDTTALGNGTFDATLKSHHNKHLHNSPTNNPSADPTTTFVHRPGPIAPPAPSLLQQTPNSSSLNSGLDHPLSYTTLQTQNSQNNLHSHLASSQASHNHPSQPLSQTLQMAQTRISTMSPTAMAQNVGSRAVAKPHHKYNTAQWNSVAMNLAKDESMENAARRRARLDEEQAAEFSRKMFGDKAPTKKTLARPVYDAEFTIVENGKKGATTQMKVAGGKVIDGKVVTETNVANLPDPAPKPQESDAKANIEDFKVGSEGPLKSSRYFPRETGLAVSSPEPTGSKPGVATLTHDLAVSAPPDVQACPIFDMNATIEGPKVKLPAPKAVVKLPSSATEINAAATPVRLGIQPIVNNEAWQQRFNYLLHPTAAAHNAQPVMVSSKSPLEGHPQPATVNLPATSVVIENIAWVTSKPTEENLFIDELVFGSTPLIFVPKTNPANAVAPGFPVRQSASAIKHYFPLYIVAETMDTNSALELFALPDANGGVHLQVRLPGQNDATKVAAPALAGTNANSAASPPRFGSNHAYGVPTASRGNFGRNRNANGQRTQHHGGRGNSDHAPWFASQPMRKQWDADKIVAGNWIN
ncbi:hypothetical protein K402DRAFT_400990 [Aulographum hederae CBS 113979]|uniref:Uncharacterized protein n=1 Tax=Aulographum hederae CBS 113979 TaxID=1176131 RepID=A0A6G1HC83_9PEZI|nr:hypothetical protein K402DRAFT_400990 [Aulographum hederae CBS 113979]